ncbi:hypothetical protein D3C75_831580 [compost metagenome]
MQIKAQPDAAIRFLLLHRPDLACFEIQGRYFAATGKLHLRPPVALPAGIHQIINPAAGPFQRLHIDVIGHNRCSGGIPHPDKGRSRPANCLQQRLRTPLRLEGFPQQFLQPHVPLAVHQHRIRREGNQPAALRHKPLQQLQRPAAHCGAWRQHHGAVSCFSDDETPLLYPAMADNQAFAAVVMLHEALA